MSTGARASGKGGATFGSKPGAAASGAGGAGGGASGACPAGAALGSTPAGCAVAVADGMVTSAPVIAASTSVLRTFFNIFPFAVRARQSKPTLVGLSACLVRNGASGRAVVPARQRWA